MEPKKTTVLMLEILSDKSIQELVEMGKELFEGATGDCSIEVRQSTAMVIDQTKR